MAVMRSRALAGRYALGEVLGTGGMATVWRATDQVLGREVAVKLLSPQYAGDPGFLARFEREARHVARLSHPRLVTVFDCGVDNGAPFIVMELVAGRTLRQVLDDQAVLPPGEAVRVAAAVCEALAVAHAAGLVHRDIKPANIVLCGGDVRVLDFGIARVQGAASGTRTVGVLGTAAYLSPEQASGRPAGPQADLYALGCVLFEMLTGTAPFAAESAVGLAYRHVHDDPGPPSARRPGIPARLDQITAQLLAKDPSARPPGATAARAGLLAAPHQDATSVLPAQAQGHVRPGRSRRVMRAPTRAEMVLAAALASALVALTILTVSGGPGQAAPPAHPPATTHPSGKTPPKTAPPRQHARHLPPVAAAAAAFVGALEAGVADGQVAPQAGQDLYNHLQQLLFGPPGDNAQRIQQQYGQLVQAYLQRRSQGQIGGRAAIGLRQALTALGTATGAM